MKPLLRTGLLIGLIFLNSSVYGFDPCAVAPSNQSLDDSFGVNIDFTDPRPGEMKMIAAGGARWVRMDLKWDATEIEPGRYDFSSYDRLMAALEREKVRALFILDYGNPLYDDGAPPRTERTRRAFVRWAVAAATHFANRGVLWEIYNEPNHELFWPPKPNAKDYVDLALAVGKAFREYVPNEKLIGPATSGVDFEFLEECFKRGLLDYLAAVSVHPYRREAPETVSADYCRLRRLIEKYSAPSAKVSLPIISSEWGYSTSWPAVNDQKQSELLVKSWLTNVANGVQLSIWYDWRDDGLDKNNPEHNFGMVGYIYRRKGAQPFDSKPAYVAAKNLAAFLAGYRFQTKLLVGSNEDHVLVFQKGNDTRIVTWTSANRDHEVFLPLSNGVYKVSDYLGNRSGTFGSSTKGLTIKLTNAPSFVNKIY